MISPVDLFDLSIVLRRKHTFVKAILDLGNPRAMKVMKSARADASPIMYGHRGHPFVAWSRHPTDPFELSDAESAPVELLANRVLSRRLPIGSGLRLLRSS